MPLDPPGYPRLQAVVSSNSLMHKRSSRLRLETNPSPSAVLGQFLAKVVIYYLNRDLTHTQNAP